MPVQTPLIVPALHVAPADSPAQELADGDDAVGFSCPFPAELGLELVVVAALVAVPVLLPAPLAAAGAGVAGACTQVILAPLSTHTPFCGTTLPVASGADGRAH